MDRCLLSLATLCALGFGLFGLLDPSGTGEAVRLAASEDFGRGELRVLYGGLWLGMAWVLFQAVRSDRWLGRAEGVWWCWLGLPLARATAYLADDSSSRTLLFLLGEVAMVLVLGGGLKLRRRRIPLMG